MVLAICCLSLFIVGLDNTIVNIALPTIGRGLHASVSGLQWIIDGYTMVLASLLMFAGATADRFGRRRVFVVGLAIFTISSALCSVAPDLAWLITFRVVQAIGGSMLNPVAMSILSSVFTRRAERAWAIGAWVSVFGVSMALGPVLGGVLAGTVGWRSIFWVNIPVGLIALILTFVFVPESRASQPAKPDPVAQVLVIVMLSSLIYAIIEGARTDWQAPLIRDLFVLAAVALVALVAWELSRDEPLIDPRAFRRLSFTGAVLTAICAFACLGGFLFLSTIYLQEVRNMPALSAGLHMLPAAAAIAICPPLAAWMSAWSGARVPLAVGGIALALSAAAMSRLSGNSNAVYLVVTFTTFGIGLAMVDGQISSAAVQAMPSAQAGLASGVASTSRQVGQALGVAITGALMNANTHGPVRMAFAPASRPAWSVLAGCGCVVVLAALMTARRTPRHAGAQIPGMALRQRRVPHKSQLSPQSEIALAPQSPPNSLWVPRYLMTMGEPGDQEPGSAVAVTEQDLGVDQGLTAPRIPCASDRGMREDSGDQHASLELAADLAEMGARLHTHTFMPLPGTPWRDAEPAFIPLDTMRELDRLAQRGASYGHWRKQAEHSARLAETARAYPRRAQRRRTTG